MKKRSRYKKTFPNFLYNEMPLPQAFNIENVTFKTFLDVEHENGGFQCDMIIAYWFGYPVGYHTITIYPFDNIKK